MFVRGGLADFEVKEVVGLGSGLGRGWVAPGVGGTDRACGWVVEGEGVEDSRRGAGRGVWMGDGGYGFLVT